MVKFPRLFLIATSLLLLSGIRCAQAAEISVVSPHQYADSEGPNRSGIWPEAARTQGIAHRSEFDALPVGGAWLTEYRFRPDGAVPVGAVASFGRVQFSLSVTQVDPLDISFTFADNITGTPVEVYNAAWSSTVINPNPPGAETRPFDFRFPLETPYFYNPAEGNLLIDRIFEMPGSGVNGLARFDNDQSNAFSGNRNIWSGPLGVDSPMSFAATWTGINEYVFIPVTPGDYNASWTVEQGDLDLVLLNWGREGEPPPAGWISDLPIGAIDQAELDGVLLNWGNQPAALGLASVRAIEPYPVRSATFARFAVPTASTSKTVSTMPPKLKGKK